MKLDRGLPRWLHGAPFRLPRPLDWLDERWARLGPRVRTLTRLVVVVLLVGVYSSGVAGVDARWGGPPVRVVRATADLPAGTPADRVELVRLPPAAVPPDALREIEPERLLTVPVMRGGILTRGHVDPSGPAAALGGDQRVLPVPVEPGWAVEAGGRVDVWVLGAGTAEARLVGRSRPVLQVDDSERQPVALVALDASEVAAAAAGLAAGRLLLAHAPPDDGGR